MGETGKSKKLSVYMGDSMWAKVCELPLLELIDKYQHRFLDNQVDFVTEKGKRSSSAVVHQWESPFFRN